MITKEDIDKHLKHYKGLKEIFSSNCEETLPPEWKELLEELRTKQTKEKEKNDY
jgi:hypothetical protein